MFEAVFIARGYSLETHVLGVVDATPTMEPDSRGDLAFPLHFGGDSLPIFRCRLSARKTLVCLVAVYDQAFELKQMSVKPDEMAHNPHF